MMRAKGTAVDNIAPRDTAALQRQKLSLLVEGNSAFGAQTSDPQAIEAAIANYETAFRMQSAVPDLADISREPEHIQKLYGVDSTDEHQRFYATQVLRARRLAEAGVRFVEITCPTVHDLHATILHQLGLNHEQLTFRYGGRDHRLTDVHGHVVKEILT